MTRSAAGTKSLLSGVVDLSEVEDREKRLVDAPLLLGREMAGERAEATHVDRADLLDVLAVERWCVALDQRANPPNGPRNSAPAPASASRVASSGLP